MTTVHRSIGIAAALSALAACGGGGGDSAPALVSITAANAPTIAGAVMQSSLEGGDLGSFASFGTASATQTSKSVLVHMKAAQIQRTQMSVLLKLAQGPVVQAPIGPETSPCAGGGSVTVSGTIANPSTLSPNDTIVFDFDSCVESDATVDGRFSMQVTSFSGDLASDVFSFGVNVELTAFQATADAETATANGNIAITINATSASLTTTVTSSSISINAGGASHTLSGYSLVETLDTASSAFTLDAEGTLTSTDFSGSVSFETTTLLQGTGDDFAFTGRVLITGANNATIEVIVLDGTFVRIEADLDGNGTIDETFDRTWEELI